MVHIGTKTLLLSVYQRILQQVDSDVFHVRESLAVVALRENDALVGERKIRALASLGKWVLICRAKGMKSDDSP